MHACMHTYTHTHIHRYILHWHTYSQIHLLYTYAYIFTLLYSCIFVCTYKQTTYTYIYIYIWQVIVCIISRVYAVLSSTGICGYGRLHICTIKVICSETVTYCFTSKLFAVYATIVSCILLYVFAVTCMYWSIFYVNRYTYHVSVSTPKITWHIT